MDLQRQVLAGPEGAADAGQRDPHLFRGQAQAGRHLLLVDVQPLGGDEQVDAAVLGGDGQAGLGAQEGLVLHADLVLPADHDVGPVPRVAAADS